MSKKKQGKRLKRIAQEVKPFTFADRYDLAVVGGGAASLACALSCAQEAQRRGGRTPRIIVLEKGRRIGASILRSGNGRCNFSNSQLQVGRFHNGDFVAQSLAALEGKVEAFCPAGVDMGGFGAKSSADLGDALVAPVVRWFGRLGLVWEEAPGTNGLLYPFSNKASSVLEVLLSALRQFDVDLRVCVEVDGIAGKAGGFDLSLSQVTPAQSNGSPAQLRPASGEAGCGKGGSRKGDVASAADSAGVQRAHIQAARVAFAPGGAFDESLLENVGLDGFEPWQPVLGPLAVRFPNLVDAAALDGIRARACVSIPEAGFSEFGEVLFREYGLSGIVVFNASRHAAPGSKLFLDFLPELSAEEVGSFVVQRAQQFTGTENTGLFKGFLLPELAAAICAAAGVGPAARANEKDARLLAAMLKCFPCTVQGVADAGQCQVHRGGVPVGEVRSDTMEYGSIPGLYLLGEALDVDGPCGGYNLHWAWTSGLLAGMDAARFFAKG